MTVPELLVLTVWLTGLVVQWLYWRGTINRTIYPFTIGSTKGTQLAFLLNGIVGFVFVAILIAAL